MEAKRTMIQTASIPASHACAALGINRGAYYSWKNQIPPLDPNGELRCVIHQITLEFPGYGYRRITAELQRRQNLVNHKRVLRLMREEHLLCKRRSPKPKTTDSNHGNPLYPNLTRNLVVRELNQLWVADITYVGIEEGWIYLATLLDVCSRKCVGWELSRRIDTHLALGALTMALTKRKPLGFKELIHHSDRGVQYTSKEYVEFLQEHGIRISMTETGNPRENAFAESFFKTLKVEEVYLKEYITFQDAYQNIQQFIEDVYNAKRLHSSIGYKPPNEMEAEVLNIR